ncbi:MAG: S9 family peptidase [Pseudomonadota bacterium]
MKMKPILLGLLAAGLVAGCGESAEEAATDTSMAAKTMSLDDFQLVERSTYFGNPERTQGRISPDGSMMSFMAPLDGVINVWVAPLGDFASAKPITDDKLRGIGSHSWATNGTHILYTRDTGGDEDFHIYSVNVETGESIDLTPFEKIRGIFVGSSSKYPDEYLVGINNRNPAYHDVYRVNVVSGERDLILEHDRFAGFVADMELNIRLGLIPTPDGGFDVHKILESGDSESLITIAQEDALTSAPVNFTADGKHFHMLDSAGRDKAALLKVNIDTDEREIIAESDKADIAGVIVDPATNEAQAFSINYKKTEWIPIGDSITADLEKLSELGGTVSVLAQTADNSMWTVAVDGSTQPLTYYAYDREAGSLTKLFTAQPELENIPLVEMHPVSITSRDGLELVSYLSLPPHSDPDGDGRPSEAVPMVLLVHGGPWARDEYGFSGFAQWMTNRGYAVLSVNYRGSTGFGKSFINASNMEWAGAMHDDLIDAVQWAINEDIAIEDRVAIAGGSYGGYATLVGLTFTPETFACGVDIVGPSNLVTLINSVPPYWEPLKALFKARVGDVETEEGQQFLRSRSPLYKADQITKPLLIGQGANDPRVKQPESDQIVDAMAANELPVTYVLYPDEGHGFARPENRESFFAVMETFLDDCLDGRSQTMAGAFEGSSTTIPAGIDYVSGLAEALDGFEPVVKN